MISSDEARRLADQVLLARAKLRQIAIKAPAADAVEVFESIRRLDEPLAFFVAIRDGKEVRPCAN